MSWHKMTLKVIDVLALLGLRCLGTHHLVTKGQIYSFVRYEDCQKACALLTWQYDRLQAVAGLLSQQYWNWENTEVAETLNKVLSTETEDIEQNLKQQNIKLIEFAKENYAAIYKNT